jgi:hypothetical protein
MPNLQPLIDRVLVDVDRIALSVPVSRRAELYRRLSQEALRRAERELDRQEQVFRDGPALDG